MAINQSNRSGLGSRLKSYRIFHEFMDRSRYGTMMLVLREKDIPLAAARIKAGMDLIDIFSVGLDPDNAQRLRIHTLRKGDHTVELTHTYQYWAQPATLREFLKEQYGLHIPKLDFSKKENGLLTCIELDGNHECYLPDRYVIRTFRLQSRDYHRCPEETAMSAISAVVPTAEHRKDSVCPYCITEKLNLNL